MKKKISDQKRIFLLVINSDLKKVGTVGSRAYGLIRKLSSNPKNKVIILSNSSYIKPNGCGDNCKHYSYYCLSIFFKFFKFLRIKILPNISDRLLESVAVDCMSLILLKIFNKKKYEQKFYLSFEFTNNSVKYASRHGFETYLDLQIMPIIYARGLHEQGKLKIFPNSKMFNALERRELSAINLFSKLIVPSSFMLNFLENDLNISSYKMILNPFGVDIKRFSSNKKNLTNIRNEIVIGFLGEISERKGVMHLINAFNIIKKPNDKLLIGGNIQNNSTNILEFKKENKDSNIIFLGRVVDQQEFFSNIQVLVHPSLIEGSAKVIYEAMASGVIPVATANSGPIFEDKTEGFIIKPCQDSIAEILDELRNLKDIESIQANIRKKILNYDIHSYNHKYYKILTGKITNE